MPYGERIFNIKSGNKTVFKYDYTWESRDPMIVDAYTHKIYAFAIDLPISQISFLLTDHEIKQAHGFYSYFFGAGTGFSG